MKTPCCEKNMSKIEWNKNVCKNMLIIFKVVVKQKNVLNKYEQKEIDI